MVSEHTTNLVVTALDKLQEATSAILCKLFPDDTDFTDFYPSLSLARHYLSEADCFYETKIETLLCFVTEAYAGGHRSYDETEWKKLCATLSNEGYKEYFAGEKCTDILYITDKKAAWDSTNKEYDFSDTQVLGTVVFGYLRLSASDSPVAYKMSYWLTVDNGVHWYDLQDSIATPIKGISLKTLE